ncbi:MAG: hypothetical protein KBS59_03265 [Clostridiales bacterium]|nr:hypothetical protein [Clostridiales bacterium]
MIYIIFFILAITALFSAVAYAVIISNTPAAKSKRLVTPFNILFAGLYASTLFLHIPMLASECGGASFRVLKTVLFSAHRAIQVFTANVDMSYITENFSGSAEHIGGAYSAVLSVIYLLAPIFTFGFLISFFINASAHIRFFFQKGKDLYVFSELNEKSAALAADIRKNHPKCAVVFADASDRGDDVQGELADMAKGIGAIVFKKDILSVNLKRSCFSKNLYLFAIGADESENVRQSLKLINMYGNMKNAHLYVFSTSTESDLLLSHNRGIPMKIRRVNEVRSLIDRVLYEKGIQLFQNAAPDAGNVKKIHAVIVGLGSYGTEMLKALTWYCQMDGYRVEIDAFDKDESAGERFAARCPELMSEQYNGVYVAGEAEYTIRIHSGVDVGTQTFFNSVSGMNDVTYAFIALGSDEADIKAAANMRMLFERSKIKPVIHSVIINSEKAETLKNIRNFKGQPYCIECIGDVESSCSEKVIIDSDLENAAFLVHKGYCGGDTQKESEFWEYEYNYNSSVSSAIHADACEKCGIPGSEKSENMWTDEEKAIHEVLEHRRWNAYMRAEGYIYSGSHDQSSRNDLAKMHPDLVDFESLSEEKKRADSRVRSYKSQN